MIFLLQSLFLPIAMTPMSDLTFSMDMFLGNRRFPATCCEGFNERHLLFGNAKRIKKTGYFS